MEHEHMNRDEVIIRELLRDEHEAVAHYTKAADKAIHPEIKKVLEDIKREEIVHIGELEAILTEILHINDEQAKKEGAEEMAETALDKAHRLLNDFRTNPLYRQNF